MFLHSRWAPVILDVCITDLHLCKCRCSVCSAAQCIDGFSVHCCIAEIYECGDRAKNIHVVLRLLLSYSYLIAYCKCGWEAILVLFSTLRKSECPKFQFFANQNVRISILRKPECPIYQNLIFLVVANKQKRQNMWVYYTFNKPELPVCHVIVDVFSMIQKPELPMFDDLEMNKLRAQNVLANRLQHVQQFMSCIMHV